MFTIKYHILISLFSDMADEDDNDRRVNSPSALALELLTGISTILLYIAYKIGRK